MIAPADILTKLDKAKQPHMLDCAIEYQEVKEGRAIDVKCTCGAFAQHALIDALATDLQALFATPGTTGQVIALFYAQDEHRMTIKLDKVPVPPAGKTLIGKRVRVLEENTKVG